MEQEANAKIISMIQELQKQVGYLEKKIDNLIAQSAGRSSHQRYNSAPTGGYRPREHGYDKKRTETHGRERERYTERKRPFRPGDKDRAGKSHKKFFPGSFDKNR